MAFDQTHKYTLREAELLKADAWRETALADAADALDDIAAGRRPDRVRLLSGALALDMLRRSGTSDRDILDAAAGLEPIMTGGTLDRGETGRVRAAALAAAIRALMPRLPGPI